MSRSTPLNELPSIANSNPLPSIAEQTENAKLVQDVLNEVEMSRQNAETGYIPQQSMSHNSPPMNNQPQNLGESYDDQYYDRPIKVENTKESSFLGVTLSDIKQMIIVFVLFSLLNLRFVINLIGKYLYFSQDDDGFTTILGIVFRAAILMLLFLILKKIF